MINPAAQSGGRHPHLIKTDGGRGLPNYPCLYWQGCLRLGLAAALRPPEAPVCDRMRAARAARSTAFTDGHQKRQ